LPEEKKRSQHNTKRILNCSLPALDPDPPIRIRIHQSRSGSANPDPLIRRFLAPPRIRIRRSGGFWPSGSSSGSMNFFTYRRDIFRVQKYCVPQALEKSGADCVRNSVKNSVVPTIKNIMKGTKLFWNLSYTIYPRFLCSGTLRFVLNVYRYMCMCMCHGVTGDVIQLNLAI
jgi:hypothetical protein